MPLIQQEREIKGYLKLMAKLALTLIESVTLTANKQSSSLDCVCHPARKLHRNLLTTHLHSHPRLTTQTGFANIPQRLPGSEQHCIVKLFSLHTPFPTTGLTF